LSAKFYWRTLRALRSSWLTPAQFYREGAKYAKDREGSLAAQFDLWRPPRSGAVVANGLLFSRADQANGPIAVGRAISNRLSRSHSKSNRAEKSFRSSSSVTRGGP